MIIWLELQMIGMNLQSISPFMPLLKPLSSLKLIAVILLDHLISHGGDKDSFSGLWLS